MKRFLALLTGIVSLGLQAQDFTFSQTSLLRQTTNPARIGSFREDFRGSFGYRNQWYATGSPYKVLNLNAEVNFFRNPLNLDKIGTLVGVVQDEMGNGAIKTTYVSGGFSVFKSLDPIKRHQISFGIQGAMQFRELNPGSFTYNQQFDEVQRIFDANKISGEVFGSRKQTYFQLATGLAYYFNVNRDLQIQLNGSFIGLNSLQESFSTLPDIDKSSQKRRFTVGAEVLQRISTRIIMEPSFYYNRQGPASEMVIGTWLSFQDAAIKSKYILAPGLFYRINDAIIPAVRLQYNNWTTGVSYDVTHTAVTSASDKAKLIGVGGFGALEFTLNYRGIFRKQTRTQYAVPCRTF